MRQGAYGVAAGPRTARPGCAAVATLTSTPRVALRSTARAPLGAWGTGTRRPRPRAHHHRTEVPERALADRRRARPARPRRVRNVSRRGEIGPASDLRSA